ncbi:hypothetical protein PoB_000979400 [Plakobranchus ocellatus]|uniref:Uncharacterized protein n=1 Tax=Plakobranchus ocellatus TaxID=259542 RepID=A0AAV3YMK6_9GAST|nr:hypothetical protein PoB_000979400 [Plakobranchus ocellatus]
MGVVGGCWRGGVWDPVVAKRERIHQLADLLGFQPTDLMNVVAELEASKNTIDPTTLANSKAQDLGPAKTTKAAIFQNPPEGVIYGAPTKLDMGFVVGLQNGVGVLVNPMRYLNSFAASSTPFFSFFFYPR